MNRIEIQQTGGFPLESDTLTFLQDAFDSFNKLGYLAGNNMIIQGCNESNGNVSDGWVFVNGELMPFQGSALGYEVRIVTTTEERVFENGESKAVYVRKKAVFGSPGIPWSAFQRADSTWQLTVAKEDLQKRVVPIGAIMMWAGEINQIPNGWELCDGNNGTPDLSSKFIVGYNPNENDYNEIGKTGGAKTITLTEGQMPTHKHGVVAGVTDPGHKHKFSDDINEGSLRAQNDIQRVTSNHQDISGSGTGRGTIYQTSNQATGISVSITENEKGSNQPHENRPPYYTLAYIQFKNA